MTEEPLNAEAGQALLTLARQANAVKTALLEEAVDYLTPVSQLDASTDYPRAALLHSCSAHTCLIREAESRPGHGIEAANLLDGFIRSALSPPAVERSAFCGLNATEYTGGRIRP